MLARELPNRDMPGVFESAPTLWPHLRGRVATLPEVRGLVATGPSLAALPDDVREKIALQLLEAERALLEDAKWSKASRAARAVWVQRRNEDLERCDIFRGSVGYGPGPPPCFGPGF